MSDAAELERRILERSVQRAKEMREVSMSDTNLERWDKALRQVNTQTDAHAQLVIISSSIAHSLAVIADRLEHGL